MKNIIKLIRVKHWIKNVLIFVPAFFNKNLGNPKTILDLILGFFALSLIASVVYIINDLKDVEKDRKHEIKCKRPIASGAISKNLAIVLIVIGIVIAMALLCLVHCENLYLAFVWAGIYLLTNVAYSLGLKNVPIVDIAILTLGFIIRVFYGAAISDIEASNWLCLTVMAFALYMGIGKRRNELSKVGDNSTRDVLKYYDVNLLDKYMTVVTTLGIVFYALWAGTVIANPYVIWTVPLVFFIIMKYEMIIHKNSYGDPVEVLLSDKILIGLVGVYGIVMLGLIYGG